MERLNRVHILEPMGSCLPPPLLVWLVPLALCDADADADAPAAAPAAAQFDLNPLHAQLPPPPPPFAPLCC